MTTTNTKSPRRVELPPQPDDFEVWVGGRRVAWLSRLVGRVATSIYSVIRRARFWRAWMRLI